MVRPFELKLRHPVWALESVDEEERVQEVLTYNEDAQLLESGACRSPLTAQPKHKIDGHAWDPSILRHEPKPILL